MEAHKNDKIKESATALAQELIEAKLTMVDMDRFKTVIDHIGELNAVNGDIVECGVWRGGYSIFLSTTFKDKNIWVCDSFEGFQPLEGAKYDYEKERHLPSFTVSEFGEIAVSLEEVKRNFVQFDLGGQDRIKFLKGFVKESLPDSGIKKISILRIDVDAFSATLEVLDELYDKVEQGGFIIFDDSCLYETLDAIKLFFKQRNIPPFLLHPSTFEKIEIEESNDVLLPAGCFIIKEYRDSDYGRPQ